MAQGARRLQRDDLEAAHDRRGRCANPSGARRSVFSLLFAAPLSYAAYHFYGAHNWLVVGCAGFVDALVLLFGVLPNLLQELLYQVGYQDMAGAKVLDPEVQRRGIQEIAEQKAHGDASLADEQEAMGLLNRGA